LFPAQRRLRVALLLSGAGQGVSELPQTGFLPAGISRFQAILGLNQPFLGLKRGKIEGLQLLIRQHYRNASC
jgi:hypothetical protein